MSTANMEDILKALLSVNNEQRALTEQVINERMQRPEEYMLSLLSVLRSSTLSSVRNLACILIRQKLNLREDGLWLKFSPVFQKSLKQELLKLLECEKQLNIREKICQSIGELGLSILENGEWPELLPILFSFSQSIDPATRLSGITIIHILSPYLATVDKDDLPNLLVVFQQSLKQHDHPLIQVEACRCVCALLLHLQTHETLPFLVLIPLILRALGDMLNHNRVSFAREIIKALCDLVEVHPTFFKQNIESLINAMVSIARTNTMDPETRQCALEFLTILVENSPVMIRALPQTIFIIPLLHIIFSMLVDIPEEEDWALSQEEPDESDNGSFAIALGVLGRISPIIRGRVFLPPFYSLIDEYVGSANWKYRHAVMFAISQVAEIVTDPVQRRTICNYVINELRDSHIRVLYAAIRCFGQLSKDFQPDLQQELPSESLNHLLSLLSTEQPVRIRFIAAAALSNFVDGATPAILRPGLQFMMERLVAPILQSPPIVQQQVCLQIMSCVGSIAECISEDFNPYYALVMPIIKQLYIHPPLPVESTDPGDLMIYRANALDCISVVGMAVGGEVFKQDARDVLEVMYKEGMGEIEGQGSDMKYYMMLAWGRMCTALKSDFLPYVDMIVPILLRTASKEVDLYNDEDIDDYFENMEMDDIEDESVIIDIRTSAMDEKAMACRVLSILVDALQEDLLPYLPDVMHTLFPLLSSSSIDEINMSAMSTMPLVLNALSSAIALPSEVQDYRQSFLFVLDALTSFINEEGDVENLIPALQTLFFCLQKSILDIESSPPICILDPSELANLMDTLNNTLRISFERRVMRSADVEYPNLDDEVVEEYREMEGLENRAHFSIAESVGELLKANNAVVLPLVHETLLGIMLECCDESRTAGDRLMSIYVMCKIVEYSGKNAFQYYPQFVPVFLREIHSSDAQIREVAANGLGLAAVIGKDLICEVAAKGIKELEFTLDDPVSREPCYVHSNNCGVSAIGRLCFHLGSYLIMLNEHIVYWLNRLPIANDDENNSICLTILCDLMERGDASIAGEGNGNILRILQILCASLPNESAELEMRILRVIKMIEIQCPPSLIQDLWKGMEVEKEKHIRQQLNGISVV